MVVRRRVSQYLRISTRNVQNRWMTRSGNAPPRLDVSNTVVYADEIQRPPAPHRPRPHLLRQPVAALLEREPPHQRDCARGERHRLQRRAHAGALGVAHACELPWRDLGLVQRAFDETDDPGAVVQRGVLGEEARAGRGVVRVAEVGEDADGGRGGGGVGEGVLDEADAEFVGGTLEAEGDGHFWGVGESGEVSGVEWKAE